MKLTNGIIAMLVTPFTADYRLNEPALRAEVKWAIQKGATGVVTAPSIGEFGRNPVPTARGKGV